MFIFIVFLRLKRENLIPSADPADSPRSSGSCPWTAARHLPSTCAGGQDDGSSQNKLPQIKCYRSPEQVSSYGSLVRRCAGQGFHNFTLKHTPGLEVTEIRIQIFKKKTKSGLEVTEIRIQINKQTHK